MPHCHATEVIKNGHDNTQSDRQRYLCRNGIKLDVFSLLSSLRSLRALRLKKDLTAKYAKSNFMPFRVLYEVHVNTMEGFWSLLRSWLRPHRGVSQERLPLYIGFFQFVHNVRRRGKALLRSLVEALAATNPKRR